MMRDLEHGDRVPTLRDLEHGDRVVTKTEHRNGDIGAGPARVWREGERERLLPRLVPVTPSDLADDSAAGRRRILDLVARALGSERRRGRGRHWSYSLARHLGLVEALAAEVALWRRDHGDRPLPAAAGSAGRGASAAARGRDAKRRGS